jgi:hypothetical protein
VRGSTSVTNFEGFSPEVRSGFQGLEADNSREYFQAHRDFYEESVRGHPKDHERIEPLRRKSLALGATLKFGRGIGRADGLRFVTQTWQATAPATAWLDEHVGASTPPPR